VRWVGGGDPPEGLRAGGQGGAAWDAAATPPLLSCEQPALRRQVANELGGEKATE